MKIQAVIWMFGTLFSFCAMAVAARELSGDIHTLQMLLVRSLIGLSVIGGIIVCRRQFTLLKTQRIGLHATRNVFHFSGQYGWFVGIGLLPLAEVFALEFTVPVWTALIAAIFLAEPLTKVKTFAIVLSLIGVAIILQPGREMIDSASFIVLAAALCYAIAYTNSKALSVTEQPLTILFYMCLLQLPLALVLGASVWAWPTFEQWLWLMLIAFTALTAHYCLTKAMQLEEVSKVVTMDFMRLPLVALLGVLLYQEPFEISLIIGALLILVANITNMKAAPKPR
ncbi:DMT family transporter [Motilimonas pumila]|nr:DMT family transporter [Motilimonas pumila]